MKHAWQADRRMSPREFNHALELLGMSQEGCGRYLGVSGRTVRRYVSGDTLIPPAHVLLVRALVHGQIQPLVPKRSKGRV